MEPSDPAAPARALVATTVRFVPQGDHAAVAAEWDAFLCEVPGGELVQSSGWAEVRRRGGSVPFLTVVREGGRIVAGALMLTRALPAVGRVGYVPYGPVCARGGAGLARAVLVALRECMGDHRIRALVVQPPADDGEAASILEAWECPPSPFEVAPSATLRMTLDAPEGVEGRMSSHVRRHVRRARHAGVTFRELDRDEVEVFHALHGASAARQGFAPMPIARLRSDLDVLGPPGYLRLFQAERQGEALACVAVSAFAGVVTAKVAGLTASRKYYSAELLYFELMQWAVGEGFRWYDFGGVPRGYAADLVAGLEPGEYPERGAAEFKRGFGGTALVFPEARVIIPNRISRTVFGQLTAHPGIERWVRSLVNRLRRAA